MNLAMTRVYFLVTFVTLALAPGRSPGAQGLFYSKTGSRNLTTISKFF